jgi:SAM-dependent methyltransferase
MEELSNRRYLLSKRTVDDRALNKDVLERLKAELFARAKAPRVIELGCGVGTMPARLVEWGVLARARYALVDVDGESLAHAQTWLAEWARSSGHDCEPRQHGLRITNVGRELDLEVTFVRAELSDFLRGRDGAAQHDLLIANALLDLLELPACLPPMLSLLSDTGLYWLSLNFDGDTVLEPAHALDGAIVAAYHRSMDERVRYGRPAGHSKTGRRLFAQLAALGATPLAAGASDWVVYGSGGGYEADEAYFLRCILSTIEGALRGVIDDAALSDWLLVRRGQLERGELVFVARQLDFVGQRAAG